MLIRYRVQNFLSFKEEIEFSMVSGRVKKHPEHLTHDSDRKDLDLLRAALFYGGNASGKSNLVKSISFAKFMVTKGVRATSSIPRRPFKLDPGCLLQPSRFEFEISYKNKIYVYGFSLDNSHIHEEWLLEIHSASEKTLFRRKYISDGEMPIEFGVKASKKEMDLLNLVSLGTPPNRLFLQESIERNIRFFGDVYEWFDRVLVIIFPRSFHNLAPIISQGQRYFGENLVKYLNSFDTGICGYFLQPIHEPGLELPKEMLDELDQSLKNNEFSSIKREDGRRYFVNKENEQIKVYKLLLRHRDLSCDTEVLFEMDEESDGTLRLLDLIPILMQNSQDSQSVIIVDELDRSLHPNLSYDFISTFLQLENRKQLIVTTHESSLLDLDLVRRDEVWFVEKDKSGASTVYSLEEFSPRYDKDIRKGYMLGRFGAIPMLGHPSLQENND